MAFTTRSVMLAGGAGTITVPPARLLAFEATGGTAAMHNRGNVFATGDRLPPEEEFLEGRITILGSPNARATAYFRFS